MKLFVTLFKNNYSVYNKTTIYNFLKTSVVVVVVATVVVVGCGVVACWFVVISTVVSAIVVGGGVVVVGGMYGHNSGFKEISSIAISPKWFDPVLPTNATCFVSWLWIGLQNQ